MKTLKINGVAKAAPLKAGSLIASHDEALKLILAAETASDFSSIVRDELPAIVSHWLQSPEDAPILLDASYGIKWTQILCTHCQLKTDNPASGPKRTPKTPKPIHIDFSELPFPPKKKTKFNFIDLFAGIGGFRIALERLGGRCVFSSEWDKHAKETYYKNYGEVPFGDITNFTNTDSELPIQTDNIPEHDILCAGFPCQPFSQAGKQLGFEDARGTLFFDILNIAKRHRPKALFLENVKRLRGHDKGRTFAVICNALDEIGYTVYSEVISAYDQGVPQNRERIFIVAFADPIHFEFPTNNRHAIYKDVGEILERNVDAKFTLSDKLWAGHQRRLREHRERGNGFGYSLFDEKSQYVNTISARYWKDGSEILISQKDKNPRILTLRECARIQGYPESFKCHDSKRHSYQQFGNSVAVPVIYSIGEQIFKALGCKTPAC